MYDEKWIEEIVRTVEAIENDTYEDYDAANTRYEDSYEESLLAYVY